MYNEQLEIKVRGLYTSPNQLSSVPAGSLSRGNNVVLNRESVLETRRGNNQYGVPVATVGDINAITDYNDIILAWTSNNLLYADVNDDGSVWSPYSGTFELPDPTAVGARVRFFSANKNYYFTTSEGVQKLDSISSQPQPAGAPMALGGTGTTSGTPGFLEDDASVAYRIVWGYRDLNDNLILSAASDRIVVINETGNSTDVSLTFTVPFGTQIDTSWFYQVYRSDQTLTAADIPGDNYQQVIEGNPTSGELSTRSVTVTDFTPDDLRQAFLYSSAKLEGSASQNLPPPFCTDLCTFKNYAWYANLKFPHTYVITLQAVGPSLGLQIGDTVTYTSGSDTFTLTAALADDASVGEFAIYTSGSASQNNEFTARSLVNIMNLYSANTFLIGQYVSPFGDQAGQMRFTKRQVDTVNFRMNSSRITCWSPNIPASGVGSSNFSKNEVYPNRVAFSKLQQPEAVTGLSFFDILDPREPILRIVPCRDGIIVLKSDGLASITGDSTSNFRVTILDNTAIIVAPNSVVSFDNKIYYMSRQGIASVSTEGVPEILSIPIEKDLNLLASYSNFPELSYGIAYESERTYKFCTISTNSDTSCTKTYNYNILTKSWLTDSVISSSGFIKKSNNKLYYGLPLIDNETFVSQERKNGNNVDFSDNEYTVQIISSSGLEIVLASLNKVTVDMSIQQDIIESRIVSIDTDNNTITVADLDTWTPGDATVFEPIHVEVRTNPIFGPTPGKVKQVIECSFFFQEPNFDEIIASFTGDFTGQGPDVILTPADIGGWGQLPWGEGPWGGEVNNSQRIRTYITKNQMRSNWLQINLETNQCFVSFAWEGLALQYNMTGNGRQKS